MITPAAAPIKCAELSGHVLGDDGPRHVGRKVDEDVLLARAGVDELHRLHDRYHVLDGIPSISVGENGDDGDSRLQGDGRGAGEGERGTAEEIDHDAALAWM